MEQQPPQDDGEIGMRGQVRLADQRAGRAILRLIDGVRNESSAPAATTPENPSQWGGFISLDFHRPELLTREKVKRVEGAVATALGVEEGAASRCSGTVVTTVFEVHDNGPKSQAILNEVTEQVASEFADGTVVRSAIKFCDPDGVQLISSADGTAAQIRPTALRLT